MSKEHPVVVTLGCPVASAPTRILIDKDMLPADADIEPWSLMPLVNYRHCHFKVSIINWLRRTKRPCRTSQLKLQLRCYWH